MKLEFNLPEFKKPKFKMPEFRRPANPFTHEGIRAVGIVLAAIMVISGVVYSMKLAGRDTSTVLPAAVEVKTTVTPVVTEMPTEVPTVTPEEAPEATTSPTVGVIISPAGE